MHMSATDMKAMCDMHNEMMSGKTDVLAGAALGAGVGYYEYTRDSAWSAMVLSHGITVGFRKKF
jgi:hypothetical protein